MNTGLQDAYNLGWKLALVVSKQANASLLDTYQSERLPIAQRLLNTTDRGFRLVVTDNWFAGLMRTEILARIAAFAMSRERLQRTAFLTISQTGIHYRGSTLSAGQLPQDAPQAGDRFPWIKLRLRADGPVEDVFQAFDDTQFNLVVSGDAVQTNELRIPAGLLRTHVIPRDPGNDAEFARVKIPQPSFYLIRPDGYVGLCGTRLDTAALNEYFRTRLQLG
jgi:hypothetical protein